MYKYFNEMRIFWKVAHGKKSRGTKMLSYDMYIQIQWKFQKED